MASRITDWRPDDPTFWQSTGRRVATRNLWISIPALLLAFAVWMVWSVVVVKLRAIGFAFSEPQEFWLTALPALAGATLRIVYSFVVPVFGGRTWTVLSTASLLLPALGIGLAVQHPGTPYWVFVLLALSCGLGGANFASSMSNINYFFPKEQKGTALGLNAGLGNLGVSAMQFLVPAAIGAAVFGALGGPPQQAVEHGVTRSMWLQNAGFVWVPMIAVVALAAFLGMNDLASTRASVAAQTVVLKHKHTWIMCWLSAACGARRMMYWVFGVMAAALLVRSAPSGHLVLYVPERIQARGHVETMKFTVGLGLFTFLVFVVGCGMGIGKAAVFKDIPGYLPTDVGAVGGLVGLLGALGGFFLPPLFAYALEATGIPQTTFAILLLLTLASFAWLHWVVHRPMHRATLHLESQFDDHR